MVLNKMSECAVTSRMWVPASHQVDSRRAAHRIVRKGILKPHASRRQRVDVWRLDIGVTKTAHAICSLLVWHHYRKLGRDMIIRFSRYLPDIGKSSLSGQPGGFLREASFREALCWQTRQKGLTPSYPQYSMVKW